MTGPRINFQRIALAALANVETIVSRWCPDGKREAAEWVARNPRRADRKPGSFKINLKTGAWGDFADNARGGDLIALASYLFNLSQRDAALKTAEMLGLNPYDN